MAKARPGRKPWSHRTGLRRRFRTRYCSKPLQGTVCGPEGRPFPAPGRADARSDIFSLGLTLYELLTLRPAYDETRQGLLIQQVTNAEPPGLRKLDRRIPADLETIVHKAMARAAERRYTDALELAEDL